MSIEGLPIEQLPGHADFRRLDDIAGVSVELRYATPDNFAGRDLYSPHDCAWLHRDCAGALERVVAWLAVNRLDLRVLVLDSLRPQRVQEQLWAALEGTDLRMYLAPPERGSIHSFGMALDLTLVASCGRELDMGTPFDDLTELSHPALEARMLAEGRLRQDQLDNRALLREAMHAGGFQGIGTEWWHYDCGDRDLVRSRYVRIL